MLEVGTLAIEMRAVDVVQPNVCYLGGINRTMKVVEMAKAAGLPVTPHSANQSLVTVFTLHLMGAIENAGPYVEFSIEGADYYPWDSGLYEPVLIARDGKVQIPDGPGWGIELSKAWLKRGKETGQWPKYLGPQIYDDRTYYRFDDGWVLWRVGNGPITELK